MSVMTIEDQIEMLKRQIDSDREELARLEREREVRYVPQEPERAVKMVRIEFRKDRQNRFIVAFPSESGWRYIYDNGSTFNKAWSGMLSGMHGTFPINVIAFQRMVVVDVNDVVSIKTYEQRDIERATR
jgi:hypothetical protein